LLTPPTKMEQCSETSAHKIQTSRNNPKKDYNNNQGNLQR